MTEDLLYRLDHSRISHFTVIFGLYFRFKIDMKKLIYSFSVMLFFNASVSIGQEETPTAEVDSSGVEENRLLPTSTPILLFQMQRTSLKKKKRRSGKRRKKTFILVKKPAEP